MRTTKRGMAQLVLVRDLASEWYNKKLKEGHSPIKINVFANKALDKLAEKEKVK